MASLSPLYANAEKKIKSNAEELKLIVDTKRKDHIQKFSNLTGLTLSND